jgi:carbonic anhydrase
MLLKGAPTMHKLIAGLHRFQAEVFDNQRALFERLATTQHPEALFITCSDSRINPNLITQTGPGDLFILRNAGNIVPPHGGMASGGEAATIEYAVAALGVRDIIVCGHSNCGAVKALFDPAATERLPAVRSWLSNADATRLIVEENYKDLSPEDRVAVGVKENVLVQLENLRTHPLVSARIAAGKLNLHGWVYRIETGEVLYFDHEAQQFVELQQEAAVPTPRAPTPRKTVSI